MKDRRLIVRRQRRPRLESDLWDHEAEDRGGNQARTVFMTPDLSVSEFTLSPDEQTVYFTASSFGTDNLYRVPVTGGTPQLVAKGGAISAVSARGNQITFSRAQMVSPPEVF